MHRILRAGLIFIVVISVGCDGPFSLSAPPVEDESTASAEGEAILEARPSTNIGAGDIVEICWQAGGSESCTISILHASGEGEFGEVAARDCRRIVIEEQTMVELFCSGPGGDIHELLELGDF